MILVVNGLVKTCWRCSCQTYCCKHSIVDFNFVLFYLQRKLTQSDLHSQNWSISRFKPFICIIAVRTTIDNKTYKFFFMYVVKGYNVCAVSVD